MLDKIALGEYTKSKILNDFYDEFIHLYEHAYKNMEKVEPHKVGELCLIVGKELIYRQGRYGEFIGCYCIILHVPLLKKRLKYQRTQKIVLNAVLVN